MSYDEFLQKLKDTGWEVPNRSLAHRVSDGGWQTIFNRQGGKFQRPGKVAFVICVRHILLRNVDGELNAVEKSPFSCPFKFTLEVIESGHLEYDGRLLSFDHSELDASHGWGRVVKAIDVTIPKWLSSQTPETLRQQINDRPGLVASIAQPPAQCPRRVGRG